MTDKQRNACELLRHVVDESVKRLGPSGEGEGTPSADGYTSPPPAAEPPLEGKPLDESEAAEDVTDGGRPLTSLCEPVAPTGESEDGQGGM